MAVIQTIRNRFGKLLVAVIAIAIVLFLIMDMQGQGNQQQTNPSDDIVGTIDGEEISRLDYDRELQRLIEQDIVYQNKPLDYQYSDDELFTLKNRAWQSLVQNTIFDQEFTNLGLTISEEERRYWITGNTPHQQISQLFQQRFGRPYTAQEFQNYLNTINTKQPANQQEQEQLYRERKIYENVIDDVLRQVKQEKYTALISKSIHIPAWMAKLQFERRNTKAAGKYIVLPYETVDNAQIEVTDDRIKEYYEKHKSKYKATQDNRGIEYVMFKVIPTPQDTAAVVAEMNEMLTNFKTTEDDSLFIEAYSDPAFGYQNALQTVDLIESDTLKDLFNRDTGFVTDIYYEDDFYKFAKLMDKATIYDSINWRHIFIPLTENLNYDDAMLLADSLKEEIENGTDFAILADSFSADAVSLDSGGVKGWTGYENTFFTPLQNNRVFTSPINEVIIQPNQYGNTVGIQIIQVFETKGSSEAIKYGIVAKRMSAGQETVSIEEEKAVKFSQLYGTAENFDSGVIKSNMNKLIADKLSVDEKSIPGIEDARSVVQWAYGAELGEVKMFDLREDEEVVYVVAKLSLKAEKGEFVDWEFVRNDIEPEVINEMKAELLVKRIEEAMPANTILDLVSKLGVEVKNAPSIVLSSNAFGSDGNEPLVVGTAIGLGVNEISGPIVGNSGVFVVQKISEELPNVADENVEAEQRMLETQAITAANNLIFNLLTVKRVVNQTYKAY